MNYPTIRFILLMAGLCLLPGCQYQFGRGELSEKYSTISVPYAVGDTDGDLTTEVVKRIGLSGALRYVACDGELTLEIEVVDTEDLNIGYRYDRKRNDKLKHAIVPTESRQTIIAKVSVMDNRKNETILGPALIRTSLDFDYDYYKIQHGANVFSLGQVSDIESAYDAVRHPLNVQLAERIVDYLVNSW